MSSNDTDLEQRLYEDRRGQPRIGHGSETRAGCRIAIRELLFVQNPPRPNSRLGVRTLRTAHYALTGERVDWNSQRLRRELPALCPGVERRGADDTSNQLRVAELRALRDALIDAAGDVESLAELESQSG